MGQIHPEILAGRARRKLRRRILTLAMVLLSLAVLNWGLQYKMSLYQNSNGPAKISVAKLWTGSKVDSQASHNSFSSLSEYPVLVPVLITFLALFLARHQYTKLITFFRRRVFSRPRLPLTHYSSAFLFRPPPSLF